MLNTFICKLDTVYRCIAWTENDICGHVYTHIDKVKWYFK